MSKPVRPIRSILADFIVWIRPNSAVFVYCVFGFGLLYLLFSPNLTFLWCKERDFRASGWALQLFGFVFAAFGLVNDAIQDGQFGPFNWWRRRPRIFLAQSQIISGTLHVEAGASMTAHAWLINGPDAVIEHQIETLRGNLDALHSRYSDFEKATAGRYSAMSQDLSEVRNSVGLVTKSLSTQVTSIRSGRAHINLFGVALFILGTFVATASPELSSLVGQPTSCTEALFSKRA